MHLEWETLRSAASWGIDVKCVELVPSVVKALPYFFEDASSILSQPNVEVIIDDGRRFLNRTQNKYDVIIIDPPPPIEAASSLVQPRTHSNQDLKIFYIS